MCPYVLMSVWIFHSHTRDPEAYDLVITTWLHDLIDANTVPRRDYLHTRLMTHIKLKKKLMLGEAERQGEQQECDINATLDQRGFLQFPSMQEDRNVVRMQT